LLNENKNISGIEILKRNYGQCSVTEINIVNENGSSALGKPIGKYITVTFGKVWFFDDAEFRGVSDSIAKELLYVTDFVLQKTRKCKKILVAGLGNRFITSDSIGPRTVEGITVTRHIQHRDEKLFKALGNLSISAIAPGVTGQTGIETEELVKAAVDNISPDILIVIDALASKSTDRLATTVQISSAGICPGSGIGNNRKAINQDTIGIPVIAVGVPTMVDSSTLVYDTLEKAGITELSDELRKVLQNGKSFFVTLNESDIVISSISKLLSEALNSAFSSNGMAKF